MKTHFRSLLALLMALTAALGLAGNALALPPSDESAADIAERAFEGIPYHGDLSACSMTADEARALAVKLGELIGEYKEDIYDAKFVRRAALVDLGSGVPALYYFDGVLDSEDKNPNGPGHNGSVKYLTESYSAWEFKDGALVRFQPGWFYGSYMVYQTLSGNGRGGGSYLVPIENGLMDVLPDTDGYFWIDSSQSAAWYEWYLGSMGDNYEDAYEDMNAGENNEYEAVLRSPGDSAALGIFENQFAGLVDAGDVWAALNVYASAAEAAEASDPTALGGYGTLNAEGLTPELLRGYAQKLRELPKGFATDYKSYKLYNFATLVRGGDGTVLLWVIPAYMDSDWWGNEQYFRRSGASFVGRDHMLFGWDGENVTDLGVPGLSEIKYWPDGLELECVYHGTDADGQNWQILYPIENGGIAASPLWCHATGFLYDYALEEVGISGGVPNDADAKLAATQEFFTIQADTGAWPQIPLDWSTFTADDRVGDAIYFDVYGGDYQTFYNAHEVRDPDYDYTYLDTSGAGGYMDIENSPETWLLSADLADRLDTLASLLDEQAQPPADIPENDNQTPEPGGSTTLPENADSGEDTNAPEKAPTSTPDEEKGGSHTALIAGAAGAAAVIAAASAVLITNSRRRKKAVKVSAPAKVSPNPQASAEKPSFCPNCGAPHAPSAKFCPKCGTKL